MAQPCRSMTNCLAHLSITPAFHRKNLGCIRIPVSPPFERIFALLALPFRTGTKWLLAIPFGAGPLIRIVPVAMRPTHRQYFIDRRQIIARQQQVHSRCQFVEMTHRSCARNRDDMIALMHQPCDGQSRCRGAHIRRQFPKPLRDLPVRRPVWLLKPRNSGKKPQIPQCFVSQRVIHQVQPNRGFGPTHAVNLGVSICVTPNSIAASRMAWLAASVVGHKIQKTTWPRHPSEKLLGHFGLFDVVSPCEVPF